MSLLLIGIRKECFPGDCDLSEGRLVGKMLDGSFERIGSFFDWHNEHSLSKKWETISSEVFILK
jgi:hypothetical protein